MELTNPNVIKEIRNRFGFDFKKSFGQNFLTSEKVLSEICYAASGSECVLEIGPGFGVLTKELSANFEKVVAIEIDKRLPEVLAYTLEGADNVKIIEGDCLKLDLNEIIKSEFGDRKVSVAANLPYYITTPIITRLLESNLEIEKIVVMVQKEVAQRLAAHPGTKDYGAISVFCDYYTIPEIITTVPAGCFVPPPKVDSAVVSMTVRKEKDIDLISEKMFFKVVKSAFSQRRKTLLNCLASSFPYGKDVISEMLRSVDVEPTRRGETLSKHEFAKIADIFVSQANN